MLATNSQETVKVATSTGTKALITEPSASTEKITRSNQSEGSSSGGQRHYASCAYECQLPVHCNRLLPVRSIDISIEDSVITEQDLQLLHFVELQGAKLRLAVNDSEQIKRYMG